MFKFVEKKLIFLPLIPLKLNGDWSMRRKKKKKKNFSLYIHGTSL